MAPSTLNTHLPALPTLLLEAKVCDNDVLEFGNENDVVPSPLLKPATAAQGPENIKSPY